MTSSPAGGVRDRETIIQKKTGRPVRFEITEQTRNAVGEAARRSRPAERPNGAWLELDRNSRRDGGVTHQLL